MVGHADERFMVSRSTVFGYLLGRTRVSSGDCRYLPSSTTAEDSHERQMPSLRRKRFHREEQHVGRGLAGILLSRLRMEEGSQRGHRRMEDNLGCQSRAGGRAGRSRERFYKEKNPVRITGGATCSRRPIRHTSGLAVFRTLFLGCSQLAGHQEQSVPSPIIRAGVWCFRESRPPESYRNRNCTAASAMVQA